MPEQEIDVNCLRLGIKQVIAVVAVIVSVLGTGYASYYGITSHLQMTDALLKQTTDQVRKLSEENVILNRQVLELTVTLRTKGVIK